MDLLTALTAESSRIADVLAATDAAAPVPTCTDWTALDLAWHLTEVQTFWAAMVEGRHTEPIDHDPDEGRPDDLATCLGMLRDASSRLRAALDAAPPDAPVWSWSERGGTASWVRRRMAHEALVHRLDAEAAAGTTSPVDEALALDGIDELVGDFLTGIPDWGTFTPSGGTVAIAPDGSARSWVLTLGRLTGTSPSGTDHDLAAALLAAGTDGRDTPDLLVGGAASAVDAWLWGRGPVDAVRLEGDDAVAAELRDLAADATQ